MSRARARIVSMFRGSETALLAMPLFLAAAAAAPVAAQQADVPVEDAGQTPPTANPDDIVVTARRRQESLQDVPVAVAAITPAVLDRAVVNDVTTISQLVPSMVVGRQVTGSSASIFLRGVGSSSLSSGFDQSVSINLDGVAMSRGKEVVNAQYDLDGVEVLKGPQALFFGKNSTGGVVTIRSADPTTDFAARVRTGYEFEAREMYADAFVSVPLTEGLGLRVAVRGSSQDGPFTNSGRSNTTATPGGTFFRLVQSDRRGAADSLSARATLRYVGSNDLTISLKGQVTQVSDDGAGSLYERKCGQGRTVPRPTSGVPASFADCLIDGRNDVANLPAQVTATLPYARDGRPYTDHESHYGVLTIDKGVGPLTLTSVTAQYGFRQYDLNSFTGATGGIFVSQFNKFRQFSQELRIVSEFGGPIELTAGAYYASASYRFDTAGFAGIVPPDPVTGRYDAYGRLSGFDGKSYSGFAELRWNIVPELELAGGARWSRESRDSFARNTFAHPAFRAIFALRELTDNFDDENVSPQATLTWKVTPDITLYGAYKQGFKSGGFNTSISINSTISPAAGRFRSETAEGGEIGLRTELFDRALRFNVTAYDYSYNDLQVQVFDAQTTANTVSNAGALKTRGVEAEANLRPDKLAGFEVHGALAYNRAIFRNYVGSCYTGQTIAEGCSLGAGSNGAFNNQNFDGRRAPKAPLWAGRVGLSYEAPVAGGLSVGASGDVQFSSSYNYTDTLRPDGVQSSFARLDAGARVFDDAGGWELALIGRNLNNRYVVTSANDMPAQGAFGTGTATGLRSDLNAVVDRPRQVYLQFTKKF